MWWHMYHHTHNGLERIEWPDGGCYMEQPLLLVEVCDIIGEEVVKQRKIEQERKQRGR